MELGFIPFATGQRVPNLLQPGDFLHLLTAAGLALLVVITGVRRMPARNDHGSTHAPATVQDVSI